MTSKAENIKTIMDSLGQLYTKEELLTFDELRRDALASNVRAHNRVNLVNSAYVPKEGK